LVTKHDKAVGTGDVKGKPSNNGEEGFIGRSSIINPIMVRTVLFTQKDGRVAGHSLFPLSF